MDGEPWSPELLDWLASDFVANGYDLKALIATILQSRTYQMPAVARKVRRRGSSSHSGDLKSGDFRQSNSRTRSRRSRASGMRFPAAVPTLVAARAEDPW